MLSAPWIMILSPAAQADKPGDPNSTINENRRDDAGHPPRQYVESEVVVKLKSGASSADITGGSSVLGVSRTLSHSSALLLSLTSGASVDSAVLALSALGQVEYAHPNYVLDPLQAVQGSYPFPDLNEVGDFGSQQASLTLQLASAHVRATGDGVRVGIIDLGLDFTHPLLAAVAESGHDFVDGDENSADVPGGLCSGHGSFVAGMIHLVAPAATLRAYRIADEDGQGDGFTLAQAIERAVDDGCRVINLSVVLVHRHLAVRDALLYALAHDVLVIAAPPKPCIPLPSGRPWPWERSIRLWRAHRSHRTEGTCRSAHRDSNSTPPMKIISTPGGAAPVFRRRWWQARQLYWLRPHPVPRPALCARSWSFRLPTSRRKTPR
jgi:hypothetical protein